MWLAQSHWSLAFGGLKSAKQTRRGNGEMRPFTAITLFLVLCSADLGIGFLAAHAQSPGGGTSVSGIPTNRATLNSSVTITTGNTYQTVLASNFSSSSTVQSAVSPHRQALTIENNNASDSCWIAFGKTSGGTVITAANATKAESILLLAGGSYTRYWPFVPSDEFEATCATSGDFLYIDNQ